MKGSSARRLALLVLTSVLFSAFICETAVRILGFGGMMEFEPNAAWGYLMRPAQRVYVYGHPVVINSDGLRGPEIAATKAAREARVVFLGDSVTYGGGRIREEDLFVRRVERFLLANEVSSEVINVSAPGWSPQNWIGFVQRRGLYEADVAVAVIPETDLRRPFTTMEMNGLRQKAPPLQLGWFLLKLQLMITGLGTDLWEDVDPAVEAKRNVDAVRELLTIAERSGAALIVVLVPSRPPRIDGSYWQPYERLGVQTVDLRTVIDQEQFFLDGVHLSRAGHAVLAEELGSAVLATLDRGAHGRSAVRLRVATR